jgi:hypothetical protein
MHNIFTYLSRQGHEEGFQPQVNQRFEPTDAQVGSPEKIEVLARRAQLGLPLWHPGDRSAQSKRRDLVIDIPPNRARSEPEMSR